MMKKLEEKKNSDLRNQRLVDNRNVRRDVRHKCKNISKIEVVDLISKELEDGNKSSVKRALMVYNKNDLVMVLGVIKTNEKIKSYDDLIKFMKAYRNFSKDINITFKGMNAKSIVNYIKSFSPKRKNQKLDYREDNVIDIDK